MALYDIAVGPDGYNDWPISRYGDWRDAGKDGPWLVPAYLSGSDYSGTLVEVSNARVFCEQFKDGEDTWWTRVIGGHGTFAIVIVVAEMPDEAREFVDALDDYPLADEDDHSQLEMEKQGEAWEGDISRDFARALEKRFAEVWEAEQEERRAELAQYGTCPLAIWPADEGTEAPDFDPDHDALYELFHAASERANEYWVNEQGDSCWIDIAPIVDKVDDDEILNLKQRAASAQKAA